MQQLKTRDDVDRVLAGERAVLYKHSTRCPVSLDAYDEMQRFVLANEDVPVYLVDVVLDRAVSQYVAERTGVTHQSPQVIVLRNGEREWHASHYGIRARELESRLSEAV